MNTDIDFMNIAEDDKEFISAFENFVNGKVSSTEKTGVAMTAFGPGRGFLPSNSRNFLIGSADS